MVRLGLVWATGFHESFLHKLRETISFSSDSDQKRSVASEPVIACAIGPREQEDTVRAGLLSAS